MGFDEVDPRQLASSVEKTGARITVSAALSKGNDSPIASANGNSSITSTKLELFDPGDTWQLTDSLDERRTARFINKKHTRSYDGL